MTPLAAFLLGCITEALFVILFAAWLAAPARES